MALTALALPLVARAQFSGNAIVTGQYEHDSNLFAVQTGVAQPGTTTSRGGTTDYVYGAELDGTYTWSRQQFYARGSARELDYQQYPDLNHNEYTFDGGLTWNLGESLDGKLDVSRTRTMVPFLDLTGSALTISVLTTQKETLGLGLKLASDWKLEGSAYTSNSTQPTQGEPSLQLTEKSGTMSLEYAGIGPLTSGLTASYRTGDYGGSISTLGQPYEQSSAGFLANYKLTRTSFDGQVTYSRRIASGPGNDAVSGLTGLLNFTDQLTPKTSFSLKIDRVINTDFLNLGTEYDTDAGVSARWQATYKVGVSLGYTFTYRAYPGQATGPADAYPVDYQQGGNLAISFQPWRWLTIGPYASVQSRRSNTYGRNFDGNTYGVSISASTVNRRQ